MILKTAQKIIQHEINSLGILRDNLPKDFSKVVNKIVNLKGKLVLSGIGKSGYIAKKISASFASTGTSSCFLHPSEASHGDLGIIAKNDMVILISNSGETKEIFDIINYCKRFDISLTAITMNTDSTLANSSDLLLNIPKIQESSSIKAPTTSTLLTLSLGDALMVAVHEEKGFTSEDFKILHPGGKIGANLLKVKDIMHIKDHLPLVQKTQLMSEVIITITEKKLGCAIVVEGNKPLGIITDGDLRRHMKDDLLNFPAERIMHHNPMLIKSSILASEALNIMNKNKITSLVVCNDDNICGLIHIHDIIKAGIG